MTERKIINSIKTQNIRVLNREHNNNISTDRKNRNSNNRTQVGKKISKSSYQYANNKGGRKSNILPPQDKNKNIINKKKSNTVNKVENGIIRIIPLGGVEEIGKNMTAIEIGNDIIVIDAGMQFKTKETPGIDYIIPNTTYLEERKDKIRGIFITHAHLDHIGGLPLVMNRI